MNTLSFIGRLQSAGFKIWLDNDGLHLKQIKAGISKEQADVLLSEVRERKGEIIEYLAKRWYVELHSDLLNENIVLAANEEMRDLAHREKRGLVIYLPGEITAIGGMDKEEVKKLHMVKKMFGGHYAKPDKTIEWGDNSCMSQDL